tara:strand:- start:22 stop:249 length:228 start_codon:yes stop_codon:yes gene_type:complete
MTWKDEIRKKMDLLVNHRERLNEIGEFLSRVLMKDLNLEEGEEYFMGKDNKEKIRKLRLHLDDALDVVKDLFKGE